jgi:hypothetical protein
LNGHATTRAVRAVVAACALLAGAPASATQCGTQQYPFPFTDVAGVTDAFCAGIMQSYVLGISRGTSPTTFSPNDDVPRLQMTTFLQRTFDQATRRSNPRGALEQWWTPGSAAAVQQVPVAGIVRYCASDGEHVYAIDESNVTQIRASTGQVLGTWTGLGGAARRGVVAAGKLFVVTRTSPGKVYALDLSQAPGAAVEVATVGNQPVGMAFDGSRLWTANLAGSVSMVTLQASPPYPVSTFSAGFTGPIGALFDGASVWISDQDSDQLHRLDVAGNVVQSVAVGDGPGQMSFDGANLWVVNNLANSISVVAAATGTVLATLSPATPVEATGIAFDGERILVTDQGDSVALYRAADLKPLGAFDLGAGSNPLAACSDGRRFWVSLPGAQRMARF